MYHWKLAVVCAISSIHADRQDGPGTGCRRSKLCVDLLVTNDTGPAHIAAALGRPTLVIFGPTNPLTTRPFSPVAELVRHPPDCAPCMLRDCPIDHRCMTAITPGGSLSLAPT